jgi:hypothetical protein
VRYLWCMPSAAPIRPAPPDITAAQARALRTFLSGNITTDAMKQVTGLRGLGGVELVEMRGRRPVVTEIGERALRCWERKQVAA